MSVRPNICLGLKVTDQFPALKGARRLLRRSGPAPRKACRPQPSARGLNERPKALIGACATSVIARDWRILLSTSPGRIPISLNWLSRWAELRVEPTAARLAR